ncbi:S-adenosyl-L-methionine-dependent methyltransferase [Sporodiniella umbellata]|nr:S-adenosyl-L-methionine-dependent methyltransferase [Sporodiniella umbellata]
MSRFISKMPKPHPVALSGFQNQTFAYAKARPSYPKKSLERIANLLSAKEPKKILDLGAGTGIMTELLVKEGFDVTAVEPVQGMRDRLCELLPQIQVIEGNSWSIPIESESQDAVVLAQCFHWFSDEKSLEEIHRILKPNGYMFLIWNMESKERAKWVADLRNEYEQYDLSVPQYRHGKWKNAFETEKVRSLYGLPLQYERFENDSPAIRSNIWKRILSKSYIAVLSQEEQKKVQQNVNRILNEHSFPADDSETFVYPHDTDLFWCQKK